MAQGILETLAGTANWLPRPLEMVLFVREFEKDEELCRDSSGNFRLYNTKTKAFGGFPEWEAGVIGEVPQEELRLDDLITETEKETNVSMSGIRVEPYPNPNLASTSTKDNKFWSKRHKYVPMHHVRPFIFWQEYLRGIPEQEWHPTIKHVLTAMATLALTDRVRFQGTWPSARVFCKGMYLGSEYIVVGDVVRLMPTTIDPTVTDIMRIHSIKLKLLELDISTDDEGNSLRSPPLVCHISGEGYTLDPAKTMTKLPIDPDLGLLPREFYGYGDWYPVGPPKSLRQVPFSHILGRCYEPDAMQLWFSTPISPDNRADLLSLGAAGTIAAREYARCHDKRIKDGAIHRWNFSETRIDALDLERHVNLEVGRMGLHGDKRLWLKHCRQLNTLTGPEGPAALRAAAKVAAASPNGGPPELAEDLETENTGKGIVVEFSMRKNRAHTTADDVDRTSLAGAGFESDELQANNIADDESESDGSKEYESEEGGEGDGSEEDGSEDDGSEDDGNEGTEKGGEQVDDENEDELAVAMQLVDELQEPHGDVMDVNANEEGNVVMSHRGMDSALDPPRKKQKIYVDEMD
ncbi:hypothetical protein B0A49_11907 [Cryomyces minteri]|uniref:Cryptic loci regulator 2 C-terminal domain-containing protein n=1 Tax=Cryomyces minteri TaxID=331657 RepID=A0A4U0W9K3_9PEZI|nr:hypothetical protein B0A49_11907 [Cryomyces minteri]